MTTMAMVESGYRACRECHGTGRISHGPVDATCLKPRHGGCGGVGLEFCERCRKRWAYRGDKCRECSG